MFTWKGEELKTYGDIAHKGMEKCDSPEEAQEFMRLYRQESPSAENTVSYLIGYYNDIATRRRLQDLFSSVFDVVDPASGCE